MAYVQSRLWFIDYKARVPFQVHCLATFVLMAGLVNDGNVVGICRGDPDRVLDPEDPEGRFWAMLYFFLTT
jgi:hypothetical protein